MRDSTAPPRHAAFESMQDSTEQDWKVIVEQVKPFNRALPERVLNHLKLLAGECSGFPVDRLQHSLLTATLAQRAGEDEEYVVCALLHDIGDTLGPWNHPDIAAAILKPFVSPANLWMIEKHGIFQSYNFFHHLGLDRNLREQYRGHPYFERTERFVEQYDNPAFNPRLKCVPLEEFAPMVIRVLSQAKDTLYRSAFDD